MYALIGSLVAVLLLPPMPITDPSCAEVHIVGVRGSGQTGYGEQVTTYVDAVIDQLNSTGMVVSEEALDYPALSLADSFGLALFNGDYDRSVDAGIEALGAVLDDIRSTCPGTGLILVGYSQGAQVIKQAMAERGIGDRVVAVLLLADPTRDILQPGLATFGSLGVDDEGSLGPVAVPDHIRPLAIDICAPADAVCTGVGLDFATHIEGYAVANADALDAFRADLSGSSLLLRQIPR